MIPADELAKRYAQRGRKRRQDTLVGELARFEAVDRACKDAGRRRELVDAVAASDAKTKDARRQWLYRGNSAVPVVQLGRRRTFEHHRFAFIHQKAASIA